MQCVLEHLVVYTFLKILKRSSLSSDDLVYFYTSFIRPILEYACPAWHNSLNNERSRQIESVQKRALSIIFDMNTLVVRQGPFAIKAELVSPPGECV